MSLELFPAPKEKLDLRVIFEVPLRQFVWWLVMVLLVTFAGYPGVVCVTPMAWLIALRVGNLCAAHSRSMLPKHRLTEAGLAGGLLGLLQGALFGVIVPFMGPVADNEWAKATGLIVIMVIAGIWIGAGFSFFTAYLNEQRRHH